MIHNIGVYEFQFMLRHPLQTIRDLCRDIKAFCQRGWRGYADTDYWSVDCYLNRIIPELVKKLKDNVHGCPCVLAIQGSVESGAKTWTEILELIEEGFRLQDFLSNEYYFPDDKDWKKGMDLIEFFKQDNDFINYGMNLFVEFYDDLWD